MLGALRLCHHRAQARRSAAVPATGDDVQPRARRRARSMSAQAALSTARRTDDVASAPTHRPSVTRPKQRDRRRRLGHRRCLQRVNRFRVAAGFRPGLPRRRIRPNAGRVVFELETRPARARSSRAPAAHSPYGHAVDGQRSEQAPSVVALSTASSVPARTPGSELKPDRRDRSGMMKPGSASLTPARQLRWCRYRRALPVVVVGRTPSSPRRSTRRCRPCPARSSRACPRSAAHPRNLLVALDVRSAHYGQHRVQALGSCARSTRRPARRSRWPCRRNVEPVRHREVRGCRSRWLGSNVAESKSGRTGAPEATSASQQRSAAQADQGAD